MDFEVKGVYCTPHFDKIKCDHCRSEALIAQCVAYYDGNPSVVYHCSSCNQMVTAKTDAQRDVINNISNSHNISFMPLSSETTSTITSGDIYSGGTTGTITYSSGSINTQQTDHEVKQSIQELGYKLDTINSNLFSMVHEIKNLINKIEEAKLADPYANMMNRVKNFELK